MKRARPRWNEDECLFQTLPYDCITNIFSFLDAVSKKMTEFTSKLFHSYHETTRGRLSHIAFYSCPFPPLINWLNVTLKYPIANHLIDCAISHHHFDVVQWIFNNAPFYKKEILQSNAIMSAATDGNLKVVKWFCHEGAFMIRNDGTLLICAAIKSGNLELVEFLFKKLGNVPGYLHPQLCYTAAKKGHMHMLIWLKEYGFTFDKRVYAGAAMGGFMDIIKWAKKNGCPTNSLFLPNLASKYPEIVRWFLKHDAKWDHTLYAIKNGHLDALKVVYEMKPDVLTTEFTLTPHMPLHIAAETGNLEMFKWLLQHFQLPPVRELILKTIQGNNPMLLEFVLDTTHRPLAPMFYFEAIQKGSFNIFRWLMQQKLPFINQDFINALCACAVRCESITILSIIKQSEFTIPRSLYIIAAKRKTCLMLNWLQDNGIEPDGDFLPGATRFKSKEILTWARDHGFPWHAGVMLAAVKTTSLSFVRWLIENGCPMDERATYEAARHVHKDSAHQMFSLLEFAGCPVNESKCLSIANHTLRHHMYFDK